MTNVIGQTKTLARRLVAKVANIRRDRRGNVAVIVALALVPLCGIMGVAAEGSSWFLNKRAQQNAADSAVVAAANMALNDYYSACSSGGCSTSAAWGGNYPTEGKAVAQRYGYLNGTGGVTVAVSGPDTPVACPASVTIQIASSPTCFKVTITKPQTLFLTRVLGFNGTNGKEVITASAIAGPVSEPSNICLLALGWSGNWNSNKYALDFHGSSGVNLNGCPVGSNAGMFCSGHSTLNSPFGVAGDNSSDKNDTCGDFNYSQAAAIADPDVGLASSIPSNTCGGSYPGVNSSAISTSSGSPTGAASIIVCGNLTLDGNLDITGDETLVIENGVLNLNGHNFTTTGAGAGVTVIFTSPSNSQLPSSVTDSHGATGYITGSGSMNVSSPLAGAGPFSGVTFYQDPTPWATGGNEQSYNATWNGNSTGMTWDLSGAIYFPNANMTLNGATDKASNGYNCFDMVVNSITSNGGNSYSMFANPLSQCGQQGTITPHVYGFRFALVA